MHKAAEPKVLLMALGGITFQTVNHSRLGCAERDPALYILLQCNEELLHYLADTNPSG